MGALDGKVALVTGAASGIGRATAERFASDGARLCIVDLTDDAGREVAEALGGLFVRADVGDAAQNDAAFEKCEAELGGIDVAFLNAGIAIGQGDIGELSDDDYERILRVNLNAVVYGVRAAVRAMRRRGGGAIVATSSLAGLIPFPPDPVYALTKHGVVGLIRSIAGPLRAEGITANTVNPGFTDTNILPPEAKEMLAVTDFPIMPASRIGDAVLAIVTGGETGRCWVCQPGREPEAYDFHGVPGPRGEGEGALPPDIWEGEWP